MAIVYNDFTSNKIKGLQKCLTYFWLAGRIFSDPYIGLDYEISIIDAVTGFPYIP